MLGIRGWYSTNILGNRDGEVLDDPDSFKSKEVSKLSVLDTILQPKLHPELYGDLVHKVRIDYYPPRGDDKEGWDNIDLFGWLGYPMQMKINFLCRDSILAAPIVLDLVLFLDLARRAGLHGTQEWLSFYFKSPMHAPQVDAEHDLFIQHKKLKNTLRYLMGEELITHLGRSTTTSGCRPAAVCRQRMAERHRPVEQIRWGSRSLAIRCQLSAAADSDTSRCRHVLQVPACPARRTPARGPVRPAARQHRERVLLPVGRVGRRGRGLPAPAEPADADRDWRRCGRRAARGHHRGDCLAGAADPRHAGDGARGGQADGPDAEHRGPP